MDAASLARELNPPQLQAVLHTEGPLLVFAGAGSGKTRVITYRIAWILERRQVAPWRVMAVTFTNKAAGEMRERIARLVGPERARELWVATFHATGAKLLRRYADRVGLKKDFAIYDDGDQRSVMNRVYEELKLDDKVLAKSAVLHEIDRAKQEVLSPDALMARATTPMMKTIAEAYASYERRLAANNAVDFGDLIARTARMLEEDDVVREELRARFHYVMVDEFQDTNNAQYRILRALVNDSHNLCVVGDDDQAIYRWRGADVRNLQYFRRDFAGAAVVKLEENYRSTKRILKAANAVISRSASREAKTLFTKNPDGELIDVIQSGDEREEAKAIAQRVAGALRDGVAPNEIAVFYRIHAQSRPLEEGLRVANVPYVIVGGVRFYERAEVKDVLAYLRLMLNPNDDVALLRVINTPARKIGKTTSDRLIAHAAARQTALWKIIAAGDLPDDVAGAARKALVGFYSVVSDLRRKAGAIMERPFEIGELIFEKTGYRAMLEAKDDPENETRLENVKEFLGTMKAYQEEEPEPTLSDYLEKVTLSEATAERDRAECVSLMTVHSAKGLEFKRVFIAALEDGMFPYKGTDFGADPEEIEEERRLAYVAITRAREKLVLSHVSFRQIFGQTRTSVPSRFLLEIPPDVLAAPVKRRSFGDMGARRPGGPWQPREAQQRYDDDHGHHNQDHDHSHGHGGDDIHARGHGPVVVRHGFSDPIPEDDTSTVTGIRRGVRVKHATWGPGTVRAVIPGAELKVEVYFPSIGQAKTVLAQFVKPLY
jgi:DNA helicase-2/ATP-dependent DNA helicase PcrA